MKKNSIFAMLLALIFLVSSNTNAYFIAQVGIGPYNPLYYPYYPQPIYYPYYANFYNPPPPYAVAYPYAYNPYG